MLVDIDDACRNVLGSMLDDAGRPRSLQALQRRLGVNTVLAPVDEAWLVNCNTPNNGRMLRHESAVAGPIGTASPGRGRAGAPAGR
jgi:molybdopterin-guanine dinucleotide biosynthesis protein A